jgi:hypothetical protein
MRLLRWGWAELGQSLFFTSNRMTCSSIAAPLSKIAPLPQRVSRSLRTASFSPMGGLVSLTPTAQPGRRILESEPPLKVPASLFPSHPPAHSAFSAASIIITDHSLLPSRPHQILARRKWASTMAHRDGLAWVRRCIWKQEWTGRKLIRCKLRITHPACGSISVKSSYLILHRELRFARFPVTRLIEAQLIGLGLPHQPQTLVVVARTLLAQALS